MSLLVLECINNSSSTVRSLYAHGSTQLISIYMYTLLLDFTPVTNTQAIDALVYALSIELFVQVGLESYQSSYDRLEFDSDRDCTLAQLILSGNSRYTVARV